MDPEVTMPKNSISKFVKDVTTTKDEGEIKSTYVSLRKSRRKRKEKALLVLILEQEKLQSLSLSKLPITKEGHCMLEFRAAVVW